MMTSIHDPEILLNISNEFTLSEKKVTKSDDIIEIIFSNISTNISKPKNKLKLINDYNLFTLSDYCEKIIFREKFFNDTDKTFYTDCMVKIKIDTFECYLYSIDSNNYFSEMYNRDKEMFKFFMLEKMSKTFIFFKSKSDIVSRNYVTKEFGPLVSLRLDKYIDKL